MDHEAYENEMIDVINRHGEDTAKEAPEVTGRIVNKDDARVLVRGLKRTLLALLTAAMLALAVIGLITVAKVPGYQAVVLFFTSILALIASFVLLYAQGIIRVESKGESK
jgi:hypothetical protein